MNYGELTQAVQDYLESSEATFVANIPVFVAQVENRVYNEAPITALRKNVLGTSTTANKYLTLPSDFLSPFSLAMIDPETGFYSYPMLRDVNLIREVYPNPNQLGTPKYYSVFDTNAIILGPTPDKDYSVELHYFYYPESIVTAGDSWLSTNYPSVLLYGVVAEAYRFNKGDAAQQKVYDDQYAQAVALLRGHAVRVRNEAYSNNQAKPSIPLGE